MSDSIDTGASVLRQFFGSAQECELALRFMWQHNPAWIECKLAEALRDQSKAPSIAGELRAYDQMARVWGAGIVPNPCSEGADFVGSLGETEVVVEVTTPRGRSDDERTTKCEPETTRVLGAVTVRMRERVIAPLGLPERLHDNVQGEAASWLAGNLKRREHQASESKCSILWIDLRHPNLWALSSREQLMPIASDGRGGVISGAVWWAFYGRKGDPIVECLPLDGPRCRAVYEMEFDGRFHQDSRYDFAIIDHPDAMVIYENMTRRRYSDVALRLLWLPRTSLQWSWLDWPAGGLEQSIEVARHRAQQFVRAIGPMRNA